MSEIEKNLEFTRKKVIQPMYEDGAFSLKLADEITDAIERQIPKKPAFTCNDEVIHCPNCDYDLMGGIEVDSESDPEYCWKCGQKLDWKNE